MGAESTREKTFQKVERLLDHAVSQSAVMACLPELTIDQFFPQYFGEEKFFDLAEPLDGPIIQRFQELARKYRIALIPNIYERGTAPHRYYDTSPVIDADGTVLGSQQMMHIAEDPTENEKFYYTPGDRGYHVFSVAGVNVGIAICYDRHFPEHVRILTLKGAEVICVPTATTGLHRSAWKIEAQANATVNGVFVLHTNKAGQEGASEFFGSSLVVDPRGNIIAEAPEKEAVLVADIDLSLITEVRKEWPFLRDRRPEIYHELLL
jgi:N-carbamoylputrescine amidase